MLRPRGRRSAARRTGFTIIELMLAMVVTGIIGAALVRTMISSNRFIDRVESGREARGAARAGMNLAATELRMVSAGTGIEAATATSLTIRVPFRIGVACSSTIGIPGLLVASMLPADTTIATTSLGYNGFATLQSTGEYGYVNSALDPANGTTALCTGAPANLSIVPGSTVLAMTAVSLPTAVTPGTPVVFWRRVRYDIAPSTVLPGRTALWRRQLNNLNAVTQSDEIASPLDPASRFGFFINNTRTVSDTVPTALANIRGVELRFTGQSVRTVRGTARAEQFRVLTSIFFLNRPD